MKQIIVVRKDLRNSKGEKVRTGKLMAQAAHASLESYKITPVVSRHLWEDQHQYKKIVLAVSSEQELLSLHASLLEAGFPSSLILDSGLTEFSSPTYTCLAVIGANEALHSLTSHLSLY